MPVPPQYPPVQPSRGRARSVPTDSRTPGRPRSAAVLATVVIAVALLFTGGVIDLPPGTAQPAAAAPHQAPGAPGGPAYQWPLDGSPSVVRRFEPPPQPWLPGHRGVDLAAAPGAVVRAAGAGVVHFAGLVAGRGVVSVDHPDGLRTTYEPLVPIVHTGESVRAGDPLGTLATGHDGCPVAACLHWGLRRGELYLDPLSLFGVARGRLLPLDGGRPTSGPDVGQPGGPGGGSAGAQQGR